MSVRVWSFVLSWGRVGINAALFLVATRFLSLAEIGLFATAFAPVRLTQALHKAGITDAVTVLGKGAARLNALFAWSVATGLGLGLLFAFAGAALSQMLLVLAVIPLVNGLGAVSEGLLRKRLRIRALAFRTLAVQAVAVIVALAALYGGAGGWALVAFALINAVGNAGLSLVLAAWHPAVPRGNVLRAILPRTVGLALRAGLGSAQLPLAQLLVGVVLGPVAAGAFQIATRVVELVDALTLSPLRFIALPQLGKVRTSQLTQAVAAHMRVTAGLAVWIWSGVLVAAPGILTLIAGAEHAIATAPVLRGLIGFGLANALLMPLVQAALARGHLRLVLTRAAWQLGAGTLVCAICLTQSVALGAVAMSCTAIALGFWFTWRFMQDRHITQAVLQPLARPAVAGLCMVCILTLWPLPLAGQVLIGTTVYAALFFLPTLPRKALA